jgi:hypothetical protein
MSAAASRWPRSVKPKKWPGDADARHNAEPCFNKAHPPWTGGGLALPFAQQNLRAGAAVNAEVPHDGEFA